MGEINPMYNICLQYWSNKLQSISLEIEALTTTKSHSGPMASQLLSKEIEFREEHMRSIKTHMLKLNPSHLQQQAVS